MSCCSKEDDGRKSCCGRNRAGSTGMFMCIPYEDGFMIAAQIISIVAFCICWIWWVTFVIGLTVFIMLQLVWCCRHKTKFGLYITAGMAALASIMCIVASTYMLVKWRNKSWCDPFFVIATEFDDDDDYYDSSSSGSYSWVGGVVFFLFFVVVGVVWFCQYRKQQAQPAFGAPQVNNQAGGYGAPQQQHGGYPPPPSPGYGGAPAGYPPVQAGYAAAPPSYGQMAVQAVAAPAEVDDESQLMNLQSLKFQGLLTEEEYDAAVKKMQR